MVWIFNGANGRFPSAVFSLKTDAEAWIRKHGLSGVLTLYPVGISVYDWAIENNKFSPKNENELSARLIQGFSSAGQEHYHYENGELD